MALFSRQPPGVSVLKNLWKARRVVEVNRSQSGFDVFGRFRKFCLHSKFQQKTEGVTPSVRPSFKSLSAFLHFLEIGAWARVHTVGRMTSRLRWRLSQLRCNQPEHNPAFTTRSQSLTCYASVPRSVSVHVDGIFEAQVKIYDVHRIARELRPAFGKRGCRQEFPGFSVLARLALRNNSQAPQFSGSD